MKLIILSFHLIKKAVRENIKFFLFTLLSTLICYVFLIFSWGNLLPFKIISAVNSPYSRMVTVSFSTNQIIDYEMINCLDEMGVKEVLVKCRTDFVIPFLDQPVVINSFRNNNESGWFFYKEPIFSDQENSPGCITSIDHFGDSIMLNGHEYEIIRKENDISVDDVFLPLETLINEEIPVNSISYTFPDFSFYSRLGKIHNSLNESIPNCVIDDPPNRLEMMLEGNLIPMLQIAGSALICILILCSFTYQIMIGIIPDFCKAFIVGGRFFQMIFIFVFQSTLFNLTIFGVGALLHFLLYPLISEWCNLYPSIEYLFVDYFEIGVIIILMMLIINIFAAIKYTYRCIKTGAVV